MTGDKLAAVGAALAFLGVAAGAFGAHALNSRLDAHHLEIWKTAATYQLFHAIAIFALGLALFGSSSSPDAGTGIRLIFGSAKGCLWAIRGGWALVGGTVVFSGSLYALALTGIRILGAITPIGGLLFLGGWAALFAAALF